MKGFFKKILSLTLGIVTLSMAFSCFGKNNGNNNSASWANSSCSSSQVSNSSSSGGLFTAPPFLTERSRQDTAFAERCPSLCATPPHL